ITIVVMRTGALTTEPADSVASAIMTPPSAATAGTIGNTYKSFFPADTEKKPTMTRIQSHRSVCTRDSGAGLLASRCRPRIHKIAAATSISDHGKESLNTIGR